MRTEGLSPEQIHSQLVQLGLPNVVVVECWSVDDPPRMHQITNEERLVFESSVFNGLARRLAIALDSGADVRKLVMICDLYAYGNEPFRGFQWSHSERVNGAILGIMSCLIMLIRNEDVRQLLLKHPTHLVVATIEDGVIVVQEGQGEKMMSFLRDKV